jgi:hypothetical protein
LIASGVVDDELFCILRRNLRLARYPILQIIADAALAKYTIKFYLRRNLPVYLYTQLRNLKNYFSKGYINWN